jgi:uncharacterized membrane protein YukC
MRFIRSGQFPDPGATVWRDTPIVRGTRVLVRCTFAILAVLLLGLAVYAVYILVLLAKHQQSMSTSHRASESLRSVGFNPRVQWRTRR